ncbi:hypothetical protein HMN09_01352100 [Mycena chlorophos]|uniref:Uncharacterized protein n=1 Tax=Mycena chlorophos TaxID=658473 RepID=A0A8H6RWF6_MYCCL|nr:hypothetical protein HMN09_01352100 [Mycena chlorophos]
MLGLIKFFVVSLFIFARVAEPPGHRIGASPVATLAGFYGRFLRDALNYRRVDVLEPSPPKYRLRFSAGILAREFDANTGSTRHASQGPAVATLDICSLDPLLALVNPAICLPTDAPSFPMYIVLDASDGVFHGPMPRLRPRFAATNNASIAFLREDIASELLVPIPSKIDRPRFPWRIQQLIDALPDPDSLHAGTLAIHLVVWLVLAVCLFHTVKRAWCVLVLLNRVVRGGLRAGLQGFAVVLGWPTTTPFGPRHSREQSGPGIAHGHDLEKLPTTKLAHRVKTGQIRRPRRPPAVANVNASTAVLRRALAPETRSALGELDWLLSVEWLEMDQSSRVRDHPEADELDDDQLAKHFRWLLQAEDDHEADAPRDVPYLDKKEQDDPTICPMHLPLPAVNLVEVLFLSGWTNVDGQLVRGDETAEEVVIAERQPLAIQLPPVDVVETLDLNEWNSAVTERAGDVQPLEETEHNRGAFGANFMSMTTVLTMIYKDWLWRQSQIEVNQTKPITESAMAHATVVRMLSILRPTYNLRKIFIHGHDLPPLCAVHARTNSALSLGPGVCTSSAHASRHHYSWP